MSLQLITITCDQSAAQFQSIVPMPSSRTGAINLANYLRSLAGRVRVADVLVYVGAVQATSTITVSSTGSTAAQTINICGVTFTARASGATGNEFNVSTTPATQATNMAAAINASSNLTGICTASSLLGVVTLTAAKPGVMGNGLVCLNVDLSNVVVVDFANGTNGTTYDLDLT